MANEEDIIQKVILEGDKVIERQFADIAKSGDKAFKQIQDSADKVSGSAGSFGRIGNALTSISKGFQEGVTVGANFRRALGDVGKETKATARNIGLVTLTVTGLVAGFFALAKSTSDIADNIAKTSETLGVTTKSFQEFAFAAGQAGIAQDAFANTQSKLASFLDQNEQSLRDYDTQIRSMNRDVALGRTTFEQYSASVDDMNFKLKNSENVLDRLGVKVAKKRNGDIDLTETQFRLADAFKASTDTVLKAAAARQIYGRGAGRMVGLLNQGSEGFRKQAAEAQRLGLVINDDVIKRQETLNDTFDKLNTAVQSTRVNVLAVFSPTIIRLIDAIVEAMAKWRASAIVLANDLANKMVPIVDQFIALLEGREADIQGSIVLRIRDAVVETGNAIKQAATIIIGAIQGILVVLNVFAEAINGIFGTNLTGGGILATLVILKLVGAFGLLLASIKLVAAGVALLVTLLGGPVLAAAIALAAVIGFVLYKALAGINWKAFGDAAVAAWDLVTGAVTVAVTYIQGLWQGFTDWLLGIWQSFVAGANAIWAAVSNAALVAVDYISGIFATMRDTIIGYWVTIRDFILGVWAKVKGVISAVQGAGAAPAAQGLARGGQVRGPGTGTSDSVPILASHGEYVQRAAAVKKYGVGFMNMINSLRFDPDQFRYAMGGLISFSPPSTQPRTRFAEGGLVSGGGNVLNLSIDGQTFTGLRAPDDTFDQLSKYASKRSLRSAGRKPSWHKG